MECIECRNFIRMKKSNNNEMNQQLWSIDMFTYSIIQKQKQQNYNKNMYFSLCALHCFNILFFFFEWIISHLLFSFQAYFLAVHFRSFFLFFCCSKAFFSFDFLFGAVEKYDIKVENVKTFFHLFVHFFCFFLCFVYGFGVVCVCVIFIFSHSTHYYWRCYSHC